VTESTSLNSHSTKYIRCHTVPRFLLWFSYQLM
jgi:hypothetical protein